MAYMPCSINLHSYREKQSTFYVGIVEGQQSQRYKLRLCRDHVSAIQDYLAQFKLDPVDHTASWFGTGAKCVACLQPMDELGWQFFGTCYPANQEREDYWGGLHVDCDPPPLLAAPNEPLVSPHMGPLPPPKVGHGSKVKSRAST